MADLTGAPPFPRAAKGLGSVHPAAAPTALRQLLSSFRTQAGVILAVMAIFLGGGILAANYVDRSIQDLIRSTTTARLQAAAAQDVMAALQEAETAQRGFLLSLNTGYLGAYQAASARIDRTIAVLQQRTADRPDRAAMAEQLATSVRGERDELGHGIDQAQRGNAEDARREAVSNASKQRMETATAAASRIIEGAEQDRAARATLLQQRQSLVSDILMFALVGGVVLLGAVAIALTYSRSRLRATQRAEVLLAARLQAAIDHVPDGVGVFGRAGELNLVNPRFGPMLGLSPDQVAARTALPAIAAAAALDPPVLQGPPPTTPQASEARQGGRTLEVWRSVMPGGGQIVAVTDLTRRVAAEEVVRQAQKMDVLGQMTGGVAHDFNNLLQVVSANLERVRAKLESGDAGPASLALLDAASAGVRRGARLTRHLLAFARRQPLAPAAIDPERLLNGMEEVLRRTLGESIQLRLVLQPGLWAMRADPTQFENALLNLVLNARDAMTTAAGPPSGCVLVHADNAPLTDSQDAAAAGVAPGDYAVFSIVDDGPGMTQAEAARALEPFYTTKSEGKGTGLGLPMVLGFAEQSGGRFQLESTPGLGTTARLYIPRTSQAVAPPPTAPQRLPRSAGELVLLVEDDPDVRSAARDALLSLDYRVIEAESAQAGLDLLEAGARPRVLFTDVVMPGPLTARQLAARAAALHPDIAVLFTSGYTQDHMVRDGQLDPGVTLLGKPWRTEELARALRTVLSRTSRRRVLLVEDEPDIRDALAVILSDQGYDVVEAGTLEAALTLLQPPPDLLVTDLGLAGRDGMDLVAAARAQIPGLPVIVASGTDVAPAADVVWLPKPFSSENLRSALQAAGA